MKKRPKRFKKIYIQRGFAGGIMKIVVDQITGVHYLVGDGLVIGGITPLLDTHGKVVIETPRRESV